MTEPSGASLAAGASTVGVMDRSGHRIAFGPIPSRRLGRSLGVNNIPAKVCSYACRYCRVGTTTEHSVEPRAFFDSGQIRAAVATHLGRIRAAGQDADHLSFVPDGEPTLDSGLGESIAALRELGIPIAVITNGRLLAEDGADWAVIEALLAADALRAVEHAGERFYLQPVHRGSAHAEAQ